MQWPTQVELVNVERIRVLFVQALKRGLSVVPKNRTPLPPPEQKFPNSIVIPREESKEVLVFEWDDSAAEAHMVEL